MAPELSASPAEALLDTELSIRVEGLDPGERAELIAEYATDRGEWCGEATFEADGEGVVDPGERAPVEGDYEGVRPMGLVQFARAVDEANGEEEEGDEGDQDGHRLHLTAKCGGERVDEAIVRRRALTPDAERIEVDEGHEELVGDLFLPPGEGPHPGVVFLGGSGGGVPSGPRAKLLASRGYAVLALAYFQPAYGAESDRDDDHLPEELMEVPIEYARTAVEWFADREAVRSDPLGAVGASRGSELAFLLGSRLDPVRTAIGYVPSGVVFQGIPGGYSGGFSSAWAEEGEPIPYVPTRFRWYYVPVVLWHFLLGKPLAIGATYGGGLADADPETVEAATIPVEEVEGPVLSIAAGDDAMWPSDDLGAIAIDRLADLGYDHPHDHAVYPDAGHAISAPYLPVRERDVAPFLPRVPFELGGDPEGYAEADVESWRRVREYLDRGLRS